jgi:hypothetical protein
MVKAAVQRAPSEGADSDSDSDYGLGDEDDEVGDVTHCDLEATGLDALFSPLQQSCSISESTVWVRGIKGGGHSDTQGGGHPGASASSVSDTQEFSRHRLDFDLLRENSSSVGNELGLALGVKFACSQTQGLRPSMEDTAAMLPDLRLADGDDARSGQAGYFAVYDGHNGDGTSLFLKDKLHGFIQRAWHSEGRTDDFSDNDKRQECSVERMENSLAEAFLEADKGALELMKTPGAEYSGSTAVSVTVLDDGQHKQLVCANTGDCRAGRYHSRYHVC